MSRKFLFFGAILCIVSCLTITLLIVFASKSSSSALITQSTIAPTLIYYPPPATREQFDVSSTSPADPIFATRAAVETQYAATTTALTPHP